MRGSYQLTLPLRSRGTGGRWVSPYRVSNPLTPEELAAAREGSVGAAREAAAAAAARGEFPRIAVSPGQLELDFSGVSTGTQLGPPMTTGTPMAGSKLISFLLTDPLGEEILEGTMGGVLAGASQLGSDQPLGQTALETATAIAGGIGMGMLGRRVGARVGQMVHEGPLRNQEGMLAMLGRTLGSETTAEGLKHQGQMMKQAVQESLINETSARMAREAAENPAGFAERYGLTAETFARVAPQVKVGRTDAAALRGIEALPPEQRQKILDALLKEYEQVEQVIAKEAAGSIDDAINKAADSYKDSDERLPGADRSVGETLRSFLDPAPAVTGQNVGRAVGRFIGDEVGILGGLATGSLLAQQLGIESPKDRRIRELEAQLQQSGRS